MDLATTVPPELWLRILELLDPQDIETMRLVHRVFDAYARPLLAGRSIVFGRLKPKYRNQARAVISNPSLGQLVKTLKVLPSFYEFIGEGDFSRPIDAPTSIWIADPPIRTWFDLLTRINWRHPMRSIRHFVYSRKTLSTALAVLPHLTQLRVLWVSNWPYRVLNPDPKPYLALWSKLQTHHLTTLAFAFSS
ncbi:hypothetical protein BDN72DRAFT_75795 [Pluteus cervinus]|uniref:Uncharacterized protein n=1 Tax=Pluteus cervinus TaxID=181527 RepID=A0ACD3AR69_9AGAR|nr:hypothetical protein BDN72DRAFT_75795 [Pluteus cervinus]